MTKIGLYEFHRLPGTDGYNVWSYGRLAGSVIKFGRYWIARLPGERDVKNRYPFDTRRDAAFALVRYQDTGDLAWIGKVEKEGS